jgi:hypothetical protein
MDAIKECDESNMFMSELLKLVLNAGLTNGHLPDGEMPHMSPDVQKFQREHVQMFTDNYIPIVRYLSMHKNESISTKAILPDAIKNAPPKMKLVRVHVIQKDGIDALDTSTWASVLASIDVSYEYRPADAPASPTPANGAPSASKLADNNPLAAAMAVTTSPRSIGGGSPRAEQAGSPPEMVSPVAAMMAAMIASTGSKTEPKEKQPEKQPEKLTSKMKRTPRAKMEKCRLETLRKICEDVEQSGTGTKDVLIARFLG